jgi:hypothetical protein
VDASGAVMDQDEDNEFVLVHFDLLGRFNFNNGRRAWVPFVEAASTGSSSMRGRRASTWA